MALKEVLTYPNPILKKRAAPLEQLNASFRALAEDMLETMYRARGIGLAAPRWKARAVDRGRHSKSESKRKYRRASNGLSDDPFGGRH